MNNKNNSPSITKTAFNCPHCGAYTTQYWFSVYAKPNKNNTSPNIPSRKVAKEFLKTEEMPSATKQNIEQWIDRLASGLIIIQKRSESEYVYHDVENVHLSECYNCGKVALWVHKALRFPTNKCGIMPNNDMPEEVIHDFEEARSIIKESPRGAAALLRLCVQKLCISLGEKGECLDDDIANLVSKGLNPLVQKSLDIVRVIGNEAVHPGVLNLDDDTDIANQLLDIINSISDQMITHTKNVEALYEKLPKSKREAIEQRDNKCGK